MYLLGAYWFELSQKQTTYERQTYSLLEWLGDVGGLFDGLRLLVQLFLVPLATFSMKSELLYEGFSLI